MKFFAKILAFFCLLACARAQGQECQHLLDSLNKMVDAGNLEMENILQLADSACQREIVLQDSLYGDLLHAYGVYSLGKDAVPEALSFLLHSKANCLKTRGFYSNTMGALYSDEGYAYILMGELQKSLTACDTSILIKNNLRDTGYSLGITLLNRANALINLGRFAEAKKDLLNSIQNAKENHLKTEDYQYLVRINGLGIVHTYLGEWQEAVPILKETVRIATGLFGEENGNTIIMTNNLAQAYLVLKEYRLAELHGEKALRFAEKVMPDHSQTNTCRQNLGVIFLEEGKYAKALSLLLKAKSIAETHPGLDPKTFSFLLNNIGMVYLNLNDYASALPYFTEARERFAKIVGRKSPRYALVNNNLSTCHYHLGNVELAEALANESFGLIDSLGESFPDYEKYLSNTLVPLKTTDTVLQRMKDVTEIVRKKFGGQSKVFAYFLLNYGAKMGSFGQPKVALPILERAEKIMRRYAGGIISNDYLGAIRNLATCHERLGNTRKSLAYLKKGLSLTEKVMGRENSFFAYLLQGAAGIEERRNKTRSAFAHYLAADTLYRRIATKNFAVLSDAGREFFLADIRPQLDHWHSFAWRNAAAFPEIPGLLFDDQLSEKGQLLHSARSVLASLRGDTTLEAQMTEWLGLRQMIDVQRGKRAQKDTNALYTAFELDSLSRAVELLETTLAQKSKAFAAATKSVGWRDVQARIAPDEAIVEFFHFRYYKPDGPTDSVLYGALVLKKGGEAPHFIPLFEEKQLAAVLNKKGFGESEWLKKLYPAHSDEPSKLYQLLWQPLEKELANVKRVWYAPSGLLHRVAFPVISKAHGERLVDSFDLQQVGSSRELATAWSLPEGAAQSALILACVSYPTDTTKMKHRTRECLGDTRIERPRGDEREREPEPLPNSLSEADTVAVQLQAAGALVETRIGYEALEDDAKKRLTDGTSPHVLMFTTHGFAWDTLPQAFKGRFPPHNPMYSSGLLLAGSEQVWMGGESALDFQDGILTAREIGDLNLQHTRLAILSTCKSGLGEANSSEGVYGLQRAFKIAGARQVLVTLWEIPDSRETQDFVGQFTSRWLTSGDARTALRETQLDFFRRGKSVQVWGAWVLI